MEPFLVTRRPRDDAASAEQVRTLVEEPEHSGRFVIEVEEGGWQPAGALGYEVANERSRIARLGGLAVRPSFRGRRLADGAARLLQRYLLLELDFHRLELECYGFNERAIRHAERAGFVREGVKQKAYWRHGKWVDRVIFGCLREDVEAQL